MLPFRQHGLGELPAQHAEPSRVAIRAVRVGLGSVVLAALMLGRFGLNLGSYSANAALLAMYGLLLVAACAGVLMLSAQRLLLYALCLSATLASLFVNDWLVGGDRVSLASLLLVAVMYLPFMFQLRPHAAWSSATALRCFADVALFCACAGIVQFHLQFFFRPDWLFDFTAYIPSALRGPSGYNTVIEAGEQHKANGFFFREPSGFSFVMALALLVEGSVRRRVWALLAFAYALLVSYSGTGILALLIGVLYPSGRKTVFRISLLLGGALVLLALGDSLNLSFTVGRLSEFQSERSSAYIRYVAPLRLVADTIASAPWTFLLGHGPGTVFKEVRPYDFHDPTWAKLLYEYGALGLLSFCALFLQSLRRAELPGNVRAVLFCSWLLMGGHLLSPENNYLMLALAGLYISVEARSGTFEPAGVGPGRTSARWVLAAQTPLHAEQPT